MVAAENRSRRIKEAKRRGLYDPSRDHASCGVGVLVDLSGKRSHSIVEDAMVMLENLDHRGARGAEENAGDGAGIMIQKPHAFFRDRIPNLGDATSYGVAQIFFPQSEACRPAFTPLLEELVEHEGFEVLSWRDVPTDPTGLGRTARDSEPIVKQLFVRPRMECTPQELDTKLYILRRVIEGVVRERELAGHEDFYICSLARNRIVYKGLLTDAQLARYYPDLTDPGVHSCLALVHARFSTNTLGSWKLAHPYRYITHNGEINTLQGNLNRMCAREGDLAHPRFGNEIERLKPVTHSGQSDTAILDNVIELLVEGGRSLPHALRMIIPEAWHGDPLIDVKKRAWYEYHACLVEPWDGPALVAFSDGERVGALLDRNGFRPCRYAITTDQRLVLASEAGVLELPPQEVIEKGRLGPGQMLMADPLSGRVLTNEELFDQLSDPKYDRWLERHRVKLDSVLGKTGETDGKSKHIENIKALQCAFGYTDEGLQRFVRPMGEDGKDPIGAMGDDATPSVLSNRPKTLFNYFKQSFAQVSNPPIDYVRETLVTSLASHIGRKGNLLRERPEHCRGLQLRSPILRDHELNAIKHLHRAGLRGSTLDLTFPRDVPLDRALDTLFERAVHAIRTGHELLILSDRRAGPTRIPMPSLLAASGLHHHLIRLGLRARTALIIETGEPHLVHHFCTLIGYGVDAVNPYLAFASLEEPTEAPDHGQREKIQERYIHAVEQGILKAMSKRGISVLESYKGAQTFDALGLDRDFVDTYFPGTATWIGGIGLQEVEEDLLERHRLAFGPVRGGSDLQLEPGGDLYWRRDGEAHQWSPSAIATLQWAARTGDRQAYERFAQLCDRPQESPLTLRGLLDFASAKSIPLAEVEPVDAILRRFFASSMSFGALSQEAHEALAIAMNRLGGVASSGEGGEQAERFGTERECRNKQVASGRFGVTLHYLAQAEQIEIKMAQGSKPGEGGQLPGRKVGEEIARVRHTTPGVELISPPPHHDIYCIEDLAQLVHDLKCANPEAEVHVKLVSRVGVGTIAAGVAKARADAILISGDSGGTGASPKTSIKSAGLPWELGLAEAHQALLANRLRSRVRLRVDGGLKTGRDVATSALLGAEAFGFGTAALVALGCVMLRKCHCNTCSVGVATQDPKLRRRFPGRPEHLTNYLQFVAQELREIMAALGFRTVEEMVGQVDKLTPRTLAHPRAGKLDLSPLLHKPPCAGPLTKTRRQRHHVEGKLDHRVWERAWPAVERGERVQLRETITNRDRTFGTLFSSKLVKKHGPPGLPDDTVTVELRGAAGQSLGAFLARGLTLDLEGEANDYVGKGLSGGKIIVKTPPEAAYRSLENVIIGNVALYGATGGEAYIAGQAGERFAVRNSGAMAVVEGVGHHGCEYMTGGVVVVLGTIGKNFAAGMSGGEAYLLLEDGADRPEAKINGDMVHLEKLSDVRDRQLLRRLIENHLACTGSEVARAILEGWDRYRQQFVKVMPDAYGRIIEEQMAQGRDLRPPPPAPVRRPAAPSVGWISQ